MKRVSYILLVVAMLMVLVSGCRTVSRTEAAPAAGETSSAYEGENDITKDTSLPAVETGKQAQEGTDAGDYLEIWNAKGREWGEELTYFDQFGYAEEQFGENAGKALLAGFASEYPVVRWYCAYKVLEHINTIDREQLRSLLIPLVRDEKEYVADAAAFTLSVLDQAYDRPGFLRAGDGKKVAFTRFPEARYNDGKVLVMVKDRLVFTYDDLNTGAVSWSPDSRWLAVTNVARVFIETYLVNTETGEAVHPGLFQLVSQHAADYDFKVGENQRPDPYVHFMEWSPDSQKALLSLAFTDDRFTSQRCLAVYDLRQRKVDWLMKLPPAEGNHGAFDKPQGFSWEQPDYGVRSGRMSDLTALRQKSDPAFRKLVGVINKGDVKALRELTDPGMPWRFTDDMLAVALEDYRAYFRGQGIAHYEFVGISPFTESGVTYRAFNNDGRFKDMELVAQDGKYICIDNFLYYSFYARKLVTAFVEAVKSEDREKIARVLVEDDLEYPLAKVPQIVKSYKEQFDLKSLTVFVPGNTTGEKGDGELVYWIRGTRNGMEVEHEVKVVYGDGLVGLRDDWVPRE